MTPHRWQLYIAIGLALAAWLFTHSAAADQALSFQALSFKDCSIQLQAKEMDALCATLQRPENPADPAGRMLELAVIMLPSYSPKPEPDAFTVIQGGPGGSSIDLAALYRWSFDAIRKKRDIIVIDQRGTGRSNQLACTLPEDAGSQFDSDLSAQLARDCAAQLSESSDLRFYTTAIAVEDLEAMRRASGHSQLNLYGVSYGTRVVQEYLRQYPDRARTAILDGVVPVGLNLAGGEIARRWQDSFVALNQRCQQQPDCRQSHGDLFESYSRLQQRFTEQRISVRLPHPVSGKPSDFTFDQYSIAAAMRLMAYAPEQRALIPLMLTEANAGNYTMMAAQILLLESTLLGSMAIGMSNSVICSEDAPFVTAADQARAKDTIFTEQLSEGILAACREWPQGKVPADFFEPFSSSVPVLLLSGEVDPITPPSNGEQAARMLGNSLHISVPGQGHGVIARGCIPQLAAQFIVKGEVETLDPACAQREQSPPFFSTVNGPQP